MKSKKINEKLALSKQTIADLSNDEMNGFKGGVGNTGVTCGYCTTYFSCFETDCEICMTVHVTCVSC